MKNIHILPTDKPSRLCINGKNQMHIYITSDEEIKEGDWYLFKYQIIKCKNPDLTKIPIVTKNYCKKIILTTDVDLDGVQSIDDEFLEWFVKNPSCESVEVTYENDTDLLGYDFCYYKLIIPKEEPKQETLKEAADRLYPDKTTPGWVDHWSATERRVFIEGAKWQQERMYSEEEVFKLLNNFNKDTLKLQKLKLGNNFNVKDWFEQFKKK